MTQPCSITQGWLGPNMTLQIVLFLSLQLLVSFTQIFEIIKHSTFNKVGNNSSSLPVYKRLLSRETAQYGFPHYPVYQGRPGVSVLLI